MMMQSEMTFDKIIRGAFVAALIGIIAFIAIDGLSAAATFVLSF